MKAATSRKLNAALAVAKFLYANRKAEIAFALALGDVVSRALGH